MSANTGKAQERQLLSEAVQEPEPKPPLGPPHDTWATIGLAVFFASGLFFTGYGRTENDWIGWTGMIASFAALVASVQYFIRAYGFRSRRGHWNIPVGTYLATFFGFFFAGQFVAPALYVQYAGESALAMVVSFLAVSALAVAPMRAALGTAPKTTQPPSPSRY